MLAAAGAVLIAGSIAATQFGAARLTVHFYLPDWPVVRTLDRATEGAGAAPQPATGMRVDIPAIQLDAPVDELGNDANGRMAAPVEWQHAGWYDHSPRPGQPGVTVISGHVDSHTGPAVFFHLHQLQRGDPIAVTDGASTAHYRVVSVASYPETAVPLKEIFVTGGPERLALLTCSGDFNLATGRYNDRLVVIADGAVQESPISQ